MPENLEFKLVDAFAISPYSGNVAGVILKADGLSDRQMQLIAREFNASETTFILEPTVRDAAVRFRWFTPGCEVGFCGHATLGAVHALLETGRFAHALKEPGTVLPIETKSGVLTIRTERHGDQGAYTIWLDMPHCEPKRGPVVVPTLAKYLNLPVEAVDPAIPAIRTQDDDVILGVRELPTLLGLQPSMAELARYCSKERIRGVCVTTTNVLSAATAVQSRFFAPAAGVDEDPVTGSVHGPLGLHLVNSGLVPMVGGTADFLCAQAKGGGSAGVVRVVVTDTASGKRHVRIGGRCVTTASGILERLPTE
ncbi:MAG TPA: PhzF family phenazine biosynthesis protein [Phycisphaerae bacterium]|nr:PhzF family phenazine biosynthesis protein [Phycisphaerae bacterium]